MAARGTARMPVQRTLCGRRVRTPPAPVRRHATQPALGVGLRATSPRGRALSMWPSSLTSSRAGLSAGERRRRRAPTWRSTPSNRRSTRGGARTRPAWCITATAAPSIFPSATPIGWRTPASNSRWAVEGTPRQRLGRDGDWTLQDGGDSPARTVAQSGGRRICHAGVGRLVQHARGCCPLTLPRAPWCSKP